jgi:hypothetical protein
MAKLPPAMVERVARARAHLALRWPWLLAAAVIGLFASCATPSPPERDVKAIASMLGQAAGGEVGPDDFIWEGRGGFFRDALLGRSVLFLARRPDTGARELYRARVRLTRRGRPVSAGAPHDLTGTALGDDADLIGHGRWVAFATSASNAVQGITLLDLEGEAAPRRGVLAALARWLETGSLRGIGRTEIVFSKPPPSVRFELAGGDLVMAVGDDGVPAALEAPTALLETGGRDVHGAKARRLPAGPPASIAELLPGLTRAIAGPRTAGAVASLIERAGAARARLAAWLARAPRSLEMDGPEAPPRAPPVDGREEVWPPAPLGAPIAPPLAGEGTWRVAPSTFARPTEGGEGQAAPPQMLRAAIRPDPADGSVVVRLVAMDMRQLELGWQGGYHAPRPQTGPRGDGVIEGSMRAHVAAAFNGGGVDARAGEHGMIASGRVLSPPVANATTIAALADGITGVGAWPSSSPPDALSLRQAPGPLIDVGAPDGRPGARPAPGAELPLQRSALGLTAHGHLIYAWSARARADQLARALSIAGCTWAAPLAAAPASVGFWFLSLDPTREGDAGIAAEPLAPTMSLARDAVVGSSPFDFFYLIARGSRPLEGQSSPLSPDDGTQPEPAWLPAVHTTSSAHLGAVVRVTRFAAERFEYRLRAGSKELRHRAGGTFATALPGQARVLAAIGVGAGRRRQPRGLATDGSTGLPFRGEAGALLVDPKTRTLSILPSSGLNVPAGADATELPLTADDGKLRPEGREVGSMRARGAACMQGGTLLVATTTFDSDEATTEALLELGCRRVVALDRGSHHPAFVHRAGTPAPPEARYEPSALFVLESPMRGRARRIDEVIR